MAPFNDEYSQKLYNNPLIASMAMDIEEMYAELGIAQGKIKLLRKIVSRQRGIMLLSGTIVLGVAVYETDRRRKKQTHRERFNKVIHGETEK